MEEAESDYDAEKLKGLVEKFIGQCKEFEKYPYMQDLDESRVMTFYEEMIKSTAVNFSVFTDKEVQEKILYMKLKVMQEENAQLKEQNHKFSEVLFLFNL